MTAMQRQKLRSNLRKKFGHRNGRSSCAHSIGKFFLCYIVLFSFETSATGSPGNYLYLKKITILMWLLICLFSFRRIFFWLSGAERCDFHNVLRKFLFSVALPSGTACCWRWRKGGRAGDWILGKSCHGHSERGTWKGQTLWKGTSRRKRPFKFSGV